MMLGQSHSPRKRPSTFLLVHHPQRRYSAHFCGFVLTWTANDGVHYTDRHFFAAYSPNTPSKTINLLPPRRAAPVIRRS